MSTNKWIIRKKRWHVGNSCLNPLMTGYTIDDGAGSYGDTFSTKKEAQKMIRKLKKIHG